jgi:hypothetical protein
MRSIRLSTEKLNEPSKLPAGLSADKRPKRLPGNTLLRRIEVIEHYGVAGSQLPLAGSDV